MIQTFLLLPGHFLMHLLSGLHFLIKQFFLLLLLCFLLLVTNQIFNHVRLGHVLIALLIKQLFLLLFLFLSIVYVLLYLLAVRPFIVKDFLSLLFFLSFMEESYLGFFVDSHLLPERLFVVMLHVSASLVHDVASLLSSLLNLFEGPRFLRFQQLNSISKKTQIVLSSFPRKFGSYKFLMESSIVVLLVRSQIYVIVLTFLLVLFSIHSVSRTLLIVLVIIVLLFQAIRCLGLRRVLALVILLRRLIDVLLFVVIHII